MRIYLFRGLLGAAYSTGIDDLAAKLVANGHHVSVHRFGERRRVQRAAIEDFRAGNVTQPIATIGHSLGANRAMWMARDLVEEGLPVRYLGTIDPTVRGSVPDGVTADNFRSSDIRDRSVEGANEIRRDDLGHTEIDKDAAVHRQIITRCAAYSGTSEFAYEEVDLNMSDSDYARAGGSVLDGIETHGLWEGSENHNRNSEDELLLKLALAALGGKGALTSGGSPESNEMIDALRLLGLLGNEEAVILDKTTAEDELTPVNGALGQTIGKLLDGRKTGLGIIGLLGTAVLPVLFPQVAPIVAVFQSLGLDAAAPENAKEFGEKTPLLLNSLFGGLASWGVLGKIDKWVRAIKR
ncbi:MAG: hypothetical protein QNJ29_14590 [Rhizobiaceae bacterium]|nr:hypothetical protein [Rhizobiaceae bacterium]